MNADDRAFVDSRLERVPLNQGHVIVGKGEPITFVCFPECGVTSIADVMPDGTRIEVALIGREGMTNSQLVLGGEVANYEASVQVGGGSSLRLWASDLRALCARSPAAHALFLRFVDALAVQTAKTLACNALHPAEVRLARWLLMCHDRVDGNEIRLTHDCLSRMLAVRRATVTNTIQLLEGKGALKNKRNCTTITNPTPHCLAGTLADALPSRPSLIRTGVSGAPFRAAAEATISLTWFYSMTTGASVREES